MKSVLYEFALGNINPLTASIVKGSHYAKVVETISNSEIKLLAMIEGEAKDLLNQFSAAQGEANAIGCTSNFVDGYRLGVLMTMDVFAGKEKLLNGREVG